MIKKDFIDLHNHTSEALTAAWKLLWSIIIAIFHYLCLCSIWIRNLVEPEAPSAWVQLAYYEPTESELPAWIDRGRYINECLITEMGMLELQSETILCDEEIYV